MTRPRRIHRNLEKVDPASLPMPNFIGPVMLADRTGVYVHSFKCRVCRLEFQLSSWVDDRHTAQSVWCPECGHRGGRKLHHIVTVNERSTFTAGPGEIYQINPYRGSSLLSDSEM